MTGWFRWWNGAFNDAKFGLVALRAKRSVPDVLAVWIALLEHAAQAADRGAIDDCRPEEIAWHLRIEDSAVESIIAAMTDRGMIKDGRIEAWERRQPAREDARTLDQSQYRSAFPSTGNAIEKSENQHVTRM